jgi:hypothetical protein
VNSWQEIKKERLWEGKVEQIGGLKFINPYKVVTMPEEEVHNM